MPFHADKHLAKSINSLTKRARCTHTTNVHKQIQQRDKRCATSKNDIIIPISSSLHAIWDYSICWVQSWRHNTIDNSITWMLLLLTLAMSLIKCIYTFHPSHSSHCTNALSPSLCMSGQSWTICLYVLHFMWIESVYCTQIIISNHLLWFVYIWQMFIQRCIQICLLLMMSSLTYMMSSSSACPHSSQSVYQTNNK